MARWENPTSVLDSANEWYDDDDAADGNTGTHATTSIAIPVGSSKFLHFNFSPNFYATRVRFYSQATGPPQIFKVSVLVFTTTGAFVPWDEEFYLNNIYNEREIDGGNFKLVSVIQVYFKNVDTIPQVAFLNSVQLFTGIARPNINGSLIGNGSVNGALVR